MNPQKRRPRFQLSMKQMRALPEWASVSQYAKLLGLSRAALHKWINQENMPVSTTNNYGQFEPRLIVVRQFFAYWAHHTGRFPEGPNDR
jgi:hypothetical protein